MAKQPRVWDGSQWQELAVTLPDLSNYSTTTQMNTAINNAKGLVLISDTTVSSVAQADFTSVFSSTYRNYKILVNATALSTTLNLRLQMLSGTTPATSSYYSMYLGINEAGGGASDAQSNQSSLYLVNSSTAPRTNINLDIFNPNINNETNFFNQATGATSSLYGMSGAAYHLTSASYTGFRLLASTGTYSAIVRVYGYQD